MAAITAATGLSISQVLLTMAILCYGRTYYGHTCYGLSISQASKVGTFLNELMTGRLPQSWF
eukprot:scaffold64025_cov34-Phaeocystis_antarctica.AAC.2